jgi:23S rRNA pseudouridine1911/1915/1917 synthase
LNRARIQRLIEGGQILLNGESARKSGVMAPGDSVVLDFPETEHRGEWELAELPVLYEDDLLLAVNKPAGLAVHGATGDENPSVAIWFVARYGPSLQLGAFDVERPGIVHRLDKDTSGLLLLAKTPAAQAALSGSFERRETRKIYLAITEGIPDRKHAVIDAPLSRHPADRMRMAVSKHGRESSTEYEVIASDHGRALLEVHPVTGRTHQIRVHLKAIGTPIVDDRVYGRQGEGRQLLHAWRLSIPHPNGGLLTITAPLPDDMREAIRAIEAEAIALPYLTPTPPTLTED